MPEFDNRSDGGKSAGAMLAIGELADRTGIEQVYALCAFLPAIGLLAVFLPRIAPPRIG